MSTLAELRTKVGRDLRDPLHATFLPVNVDDLINAGIEEVSRVYPREMVDSIPAVAATYAYATELDSAFRVEMWRSGRLHMMIDRDEGENSQTGWELFAGQIRFPRATIDHSVPATDTFEVWGYAPYSQLLADAQESEMDDTAEWGVRRYARASAFQLMHADRALFKQWQAASQNSDTTNNQLQQMVTLYTSEWDRTRNYLRRLRRV